MSDQHQQPHTRLNTTVYPDSPPGTSSAQTCGPRKSLKIEMACARGESNRPAATVNVLPDDIFLDTFAFCLPDPHIDPSGHTRVWQRLVHVCQRWRRRIIFASPRHLDLHLYCSQRKPFKKRFGFGRVEPRIDLSCWPELPLIVHSHIINEVDPEFIAALGHPDRVRRIKLITWSSRVEEVEALMKVPFPVLTHLELEGNEKDVLEIYGEFLGGSAPCLQHLRLCDVALRGLPTLLSSALDLVSLQLEGITEMGYLTPETMAGGLDGLTRLRTLCIKFPSYTELDEQWQTFGLRDSPTWADLPALTEFVFQGYSEYLECFVAQIDAPRVDDIRIKYYYTPEVQTRQLSQFIDRTANFKLSQVSRAEVIFNYHVIIELDHAQGESHQAYLSFTILDDESDFPVPYMVRVLGPLVAILSDVGHLSVSTPRQARQVEEEGVDWLPLLRLFPAVEALEVSGGLAGYIASMLEDTAEEMVAVLLPALRLLWLDDDDDDDEDDSKKSKPVGSTERFLSLRQLSGRPVTIARTEDEFIEILDAHRMR